MILTQSRLKKRTRYVLRSTLCISRTSGAGMPPALIMMEVLLVIMASSASLDGFDGLRLERDPR